MPWGLSDSAMAEYPDGRGVILFGGNEKGDYIKGILTLRFGAQILDWGTIADAILEYGRRNHVVIPLQ